MKKKKNKKGMAGSTGESLETIEARLRKYKHEARERAKSAGGSLETRQQELINEVRTRSTKNSKKRSSGRTLVGRLKEYRDARFNEEKKRFFDSVLVVYGD